jgi:predicted O-methyltransferase YrrM
MIRALYRTIVPQPVRSFIRKKLSPPPEVAEYRRVSRIGADNPNEWIRKSAEIGGWLFEGEHEFLWDLATRSTNGDVLEIGTWMGKSACILAGACKDTAPGTCVVCVDTFRMTGPNTQEQYHRRLVDSTGTFYQFLGNASRLGFESSIVPLAALSRRAVPLLRGPFRMVFLDGSHDLENTRADVDVCLPLLAMGGVLALHDSLGTGWPEVVAYVSNELSGRAGLKLIDQRGTITAFEKNDE